MEPFSIAMALGGVVSAFSSILGGVGAGNAEAEAGRRARAAAEEQARYAEMAALDATLRGAEKAQAYRMAGSQTIAQQKVAYAGAGVDVASGTAADMYASTRAMSELDALTAKNNAAREAWGYKTDARSLRISGQYAQQAGQNRATASILGGVAGGVGYLGQAAGSYINNRQNPYIAKK